MNIFHSSEKRQFYCWIDSSRFMVNNNINIVKQIQSISRPDAQNDLENLMFIPNPNFINFISPFQASTTNYYRAEYNLERSRCYSYPDYSSRLTSLFLFESKKEADKYGEREKYIATGKRSLRIGESEGEYIYSTHDMTWIDFLREEHSLDEEMIDYIGEKYWKGNKTTEQVLMSCGRPWSSEPIIECLYEGTIRFQ